MDSSRAWLTIVADNNEGDDDDYKDNEDDDDDDGLRADRWPTRSRKQLTHRHVRHSSTRVNVITDKEWNSNVLKFAKVECDLSIFTNLKLSFVVVFFFNVFIIILLSLLWCIFGYLEGEDGGFKSWKIGWVEPYVNLVCTL